MIILKLNILKKITLGLSTIICTCALYSNANADADQEVIENDSIILQEEESTDSIVSQEEESTDSIVSQEEESTDALSVNSNIENIPNYNAENNTDKVKENAVKKLVNKKSVDRGVFALVGAAAFFGLALAGFGSYKVCSRIHAKREACKHSNWKRN